MRAPGEQARSSGKTSTKDLVAALLAPLGPTVAPPESFNNELGLPWTALRAGPDTRHLVLEFSARGAGHIAAAAAAIPPSIGVVLNVGSAHLGEFGSAEGIARAKGELVEALPGNGTAVLNADDPRVAGMAARTRARVLTTGRGDDAEVRATDVVLDDAGRAHFTLQAAGAAHPVALRVVGEHQVDNALSAAGAALRAARSPAAGHPGRGCLQRQPVAAGSAGRRRARVPAADRAGCIGAAETAGGEDGRAAAPRLQSAG